ncbi:hypothetical protein ACJX0J_029602 [Zea mays]
MSGTEKTPQVATIHHISPPPKCVKFCYDLAVVALILKIYNKYQVEQIFLILHRTFYFKNCFLAQETLQKCLLKMEDDSQTSKKILKPMNKQETLIIYDASWTLERKPPYMFKETILTALNLHLFGTIFRIPHSSREEKTQLMIKPHQIWHELKTPKGNEMKITSKRGTRKMNASSIRYLCIKNAGNPWVADSSLIVNILLFWSTASILTKTEQNNGTRMKSEGDLLFLVICCL